MVNRLNQAGEVSTVQKLTPVHDITWYVKWIGTVMMIIAVSMRSIPDMPRVLDQGFSFCDLCCWLFVAWKWHDRALLVVNAVCLPMLLTGLLTYFFT